MRRALTNLNSDLAQQYPDYVCRITSEEGDIGRGHLSKFQELETQTPAIVTTSQLLTRSTCFVMLLLTLLFEVGEKGPSVCARRRRISSTGMALRQELC